MFNLVRLCYLSQSCLIGRLETETDSTKYGFRSGSNHRICTPIISEKLFGLTKCPTIFNMVNPRPHSFHEVNTNQS